MAPAVNRTLSVTWGSFTVGGNTDRELDGQIDIHVGWVTSNVSFTVLIQADQGAADPDIDFATKCDAIETNFRTPRLDLVVSQGAATLVSFSHTTSTGFTGVPSISKSEDDANTGYSRRYHISIDVEMPADVTLTNGRREADIRVIFSPSRRRRCEISGVYTSLPPAGGAARAQYQASIDAYALTVLTALGGNWELAEEPSVSEDDVQKIVNFARVYDELIFNQAGGGPDNTAIVRQTLRISRARTAPGDTDPGGRGGGGTAWGGIGGGGFNFGGVGAQGMSNAGGSDWGGIGGTPGGPGGGGGAQPGGSVNRLIEVDAAYECWVDHTVTTDLEGLYKTIKSFIISHIKSVLSVGAFAVTDDRPTFDFDDNRISASIRGVGAGNSGLLQYTMSVENSQDPGVVLVPAWTGNTYSKYAYRGPATALETITEQALVFGQSNMFPPGSTHPTLGSDDGWVLRPSSVTRQPLRIGLDGNTIDVTEITRVTVREFFARIGDVGG